MSVSCECCVLSGRDLFDWPIIRVEESECVASECDGAAWIMRRPLPTRDCTAMGKIKGNSWTSGLIEIDSTMKMRFLLDGTLSCLVVTNSYRNFKGSQCLLGVGNYRVGQK
jgi:hypothetical protein